MKAVYHVLVSSAETKGAFNTGFAPVNLHRPTELRDFVLQFATLLGFFKMNVCNAHAGTRAHELQLLEVGGWQNPKYARSVSEQRQAIVVTNGISLSI